MNSKVKNILEGKSVRETITEVKGDFTKEIADSIDYSGLEKEISKRIGTKVTFKSSVNSRGHLELESQELVDKAGIFASVLKTLKVINFGSGIAGDGNAWLPIHFKFTYKDGGSNGAAIVDSWYDFKANKWVFRQ